MSSRGFNLLVRDFDTDERAVTLRSSSLPSYETVMERAFKAHFKARQSSFDAHLHLERGECSVRVVIGKEEWESGRLVLGPQPVTIYIHFVPKRGQVLGQTGRMPGRMLVARERPKTEGRIMEPHRRNDFPSMPPSPYNDLPHTAPPRHNSFPSMAPPRHNNFPYATTRERTRRTDQREPGGYGEPYPRASRPSIAAPPVAGRGAYQYAAPQPAAGQQQLGQAPYPPYYQAGPYNYSLQQPTYQQPISTSGYAAAGYTPGEQARRGLDNLAAPTPRRREPAPSREEEEQLYASDLYRKDVRGYVRRPKPKKPKNFSPPGPPTYHINSRGYVRGLRQQAPAAREPAPSPGLFVSVKEEEDEDVEVDRGRGHIRCGGESHSQPFTGFNRFQPPVAAGQQQRQRPMVSSFEPTIKASSSTPGSARKRARMFDMPSSSSDDDALLSKSQRVVRKRRVVESSSSLKAEAEEASNSCSERQETDNDEGSEEEESDDGHSEMEYTASWSTFRESLRHNRHGTEALLEETARESASASWRSKQRNHVNYGGSPNPEDDSELVREERVLGLQAAIEPEHSVIIKTEEDLVGADAVEKDNVGVGEDDDVVEIDADTFRRSLKMGRQRGVGVKREL